MFSFMDTAQNLGYAKPYCLNTAPVSAISFVLCPESSYLALTIVLSIQNVTNGNNKICIQILGDRSSTKTRNVKYSFILNKSNQLFIHRSSEV